MAESASDDAVSLSQVVQVVRRHLLGIALVTLVAVVAALAVGGYLLGGTYSARAVVTLTPLPDNPISAAQPRAVSTTTESSVVTSTSVAELAGQSLSWQASTRDLLAHVSVTSPLDSQILQITFEGSSPSQAADGANAFATSYLAYRKQVAQNQIDSVVTRLQDQISTLTKQVDAAQGSTTTGSQASRSKAATTVRQLGALVQSLRQQVSAAQSSPTDAGQLAGRALAPTTASGPAPRALGAGGLVLGLLLGTALAFVRDGRDHRVRDAARLEHTTGAPTLAVLRRDSDPDAAAEQMRRIAATLTDDRLTDRHRLVVLAAGDAPASDAAARLAQTLADSGRRTALLAVGERLPAIARALDLHPAPPREGRSSAGQRVTGGGLLDVVSLGSERRLPHEMVAPAEPLGDLLEQADTRTLVLDAVNVDRPSSAMLLARLGKRCVLFADSQRTSLDDVTRMVHDLQLVDAELVGTVLVQSPRRRSRGEARRGRSTSSAAGGAAAAASTPAAVAPAREAGAPPVSGTGSRDVLPPSGRPADRPATRPAERDGGKSGAPAQPVERTGGRR